MAKKQVPKAELSYRKAILMTVIAAFFLLITNTAIWVNNQVFDTKNFTNTTTTSLTSESSRTAMAQEITDRIFIDRPVIKRVAGDFSTKIISGLLATEQFNNVLTPAVERIQAYATSSNQQTVAVELGGIKDVITKITNLSDSLGREAAINAENIPDRIELLNADDVPDFYKIGVIFLWLAPLSFFAALGLLIYPYLKKIKENKKVLITQGAIITIASFVGLLVGPLFRPPVLASVDGPNGRVIVGNLYDAFIATFNSQTIVLTLIGILMVLIGVTWLGYPYAHKAFTSKKK